MCDVCKARDRLTAAEQAATEAAAEVAGTIVDLLHEGGSVLKSLLYWADNAGESDLAKAIRAFQAADSEHKAASEGILRMLSTHGTFLGHVVVVTPDESQA